MVPEETYFVSISLFRLNAIFDAGMPLGMLRNGKRTF
jgi:hypothetical protein